MYNCWKTLSVLHMVALIFVMIIVCCNFFPGDKDAAIRRFLLAASKAIYTVQIVYCCGHGVQQRSRQGMLEDSV